MTCRISSDEPNFAAKMRPDSDAASGGGLKTVRTGRWEGGLKSVGTRMWLNIGPPDPDETHRLCHDTRAHMCRPRAPAARTHAARRGISRHRRAIFRGRPLHTAGLDGSPDSCAARRQARVGFSGMWLGGRAKRKPLTTLAMILAAMSLATPPAEAPQLR